jgi:hypothetical protein
VLCALRWRVMREMLIALSSSSYFHFWRAALFAVSTREAQHTPGAHEPIWPMHPEKAFAASSCKQREEHTSPEVFQRYKQKGKVPCRIIPLSQMSKTSGRRQPKRTVANSKERSCGSLTRRTFPQAFLPRPPPSDHQGESSSRLSPWSSRFCWR